MDKADQEYRNHVSSTVNEICEAVSEDIQHHFDKYGAQRLDDGNWLKVIIEEEGEAVEAINKLNFSEAYKEIKQVIACWMRMYVELERMESGTDEAEKSRYGRAT